jgi:hypothetical protein
VVTGGDGVVTEVVTPSNSCCTTILDIVSPPVTTFLPKHSQNNNACAEADILIRNQTPKVEVLGESGNQGGDTCLDNSQNLLEEGLESVTTSFQQGGDTSSKLEKVTDEDAQKLRDIALVWWPEYYPEQMQSLLTQMYSWQTPGTKYNVATIAEWLQGEDELIRDRITELIHRGGE